MKEGFQFLGAEFHPLRTPGPPPGTLDRSGPGLQLSQSQAQEGGFSRAVGSHHSGPSRSKGHREVMEDLRSRRVVSKAHMGKCQHSARPPGFRTGGCGPLRPISPKGEKFFTKKGFLSSPSGFSRARGGFSGGAGRQEEKSPGKKASSSDFPQRDGSHERNPGRGHVNAAPSGEAEGENTPWGALVVVRARRNCQCHGRSFRLAVTHGVLLCGDGNAKARGAWAMLKQRVHLRPGGCQGALVGVGDAEKKESAFPLDKGQKRSIFRHTFLGQKISENPPWGEM